MTATRTEKQQLQTEWDRLKRRGQKPVAIGPFEGKP